MSKRKTRIVTRCEPRCIGRPGVRGGPCIKCHRNYAETLGKCSVPDRPWTKAERGKRLIARLRRKLLTLSQPEKRAIKKQIANLIKEIKKT